jgi:hypothetical protein
MVLITPLPIGTWELRLSIGMSMKLNSQRRLHGPDPFLWPATATRQESPSRSETQRGIEQVILATAPMRADKICDHR